MGGGENQYDLKLGLDTGLAKRDVDDVTGALFRSGDAADRVAARSGQASAAASRYGAASRQAAAGASAASTANDRLSASALKVDRTLSQTIKTVLTLGTAWISLSAGSAALTGVVNDFTGMESALISVTKTTGLAGAELKDFYKDVLQLSTGAIPLATKDLLDIGSAAGSLGVQGSANILLYTQTIGKLSAASEDLKGSDAATTLTQMMNVQGEGPEHVDKLASVIVRLGLETATTEKGIASVALEVAKSTAPFHIGTANAAAFGAAMGEMRIQSELGGSAIGRTFREIQSAIALGGKALQNFAKVSGVSVAEFKKTFTDDPTQGVLLFLKGLSTYGRNAGVVLEKLGLSGDELAKVLPSLAENYGRLAQRIATAKEEEQNATALNTKAAQVFNSTTSDLERLQNAWEGVRVEVGEGMSPALRQITADLLSFLSAQGDAAGQLGNQFGSALVQVAGLLLVVARNFDVVKSILLVLLAFKIALWFEGMVSGLFRAIAALQAYTAAQSEATAATALFGTTVTTVSPILDQYGRAIVTTTTNTSAAGVASSRFLTGGITPLTIGLGALLAVLLIANSKIEEFSRQAQAAMEAMVKENNDFAASIERIKNLGDTVKGALGAEAEAAELTKKLIAAGNIDPKSIEGQRIAQQNALEFHGKRTEALFAERDALKVAQKAQVDYGTQLDQLKKQESDLTDEITRQEAARQKGLGQGRGVGVVQANEAADQIASSQAKLDAVQAKIKDTEIAYQRAGISVKDLTTTVGNLTTTTEGYVAPAAKATKGVGDLAGKVDHAAAQFAKLSLEIETAITGQNAIADAYGRSSKEGRQAELQAEENNRVLNKADELQGKLRTSIEDRTRVEIQAERTAVGAKTIASLKDQVAAAEELQSALQSGLSPAIEAAKRKQELLAASTDATTGSAANQSDTIDGLVAKLFNLGKQNAFLEQKRQLEESNAAMTKAAETWDGTAASIEVTNNVLTVNNSIHQQTIGLLGDEAAALARLIRQQQVLDALFSARMRLGRLEEETRQQEDLFNVKRGDFLFESQYQEALRKVNLEHEVRSALLSVEFDRQKALTGIKREDFATEEAFEAQRSKVGAQFDDIAKRTEAAVRKQGELYVEIHKIDTLSSDVWGAFADTMKSAITQAFETGKVDWESLWKSLMDRLLGLFLDVLQEMLEQWIIKQLQMAAASKAIQSGTGTSGGTGGVGVSVPMGGWGGGGGGFGGLIGSAGTSGVAGSGSGLAGLFSGTGAAGAVGMVAAWVVVLAAFAIGVNKLSAHLQKTEESVISFNSSLDVQMVKGGAHINGLVTAGQQLAEQIKSFFIAYGGIFDGLQGSIAIKRRGRGGNTEWKVYVDGIVTNFGKDAEAAMNFALIEAIKHSDSIGLDPLVVAAIKDYTGKSIDEFKAQIEFAQRLATQNLPGISGDVAAAAQQYFSDLHQAQTTFKDDAVALDAAIQSITTKFENTVQGLKNSALGIDTSTADFLASLLAFNQGMDKASEQARKQVEDRIAATQAQIDGMGTGPKPNLRNGSEEDRARAQADWDATIARLRHQIEEYTAELDKIPQKLSDSEISMAVFDSLYKYLEGDKKYAKQAHEYALMKVELEFASIKLQLIALGKWEEFAGMFDDALAAARAAAGKPAGGGHGGGGNRQQDRQDFRNELRDIERSALPDSVRGVLELSDRLADLTKRAKELKIAETELAHARQVLIDQQRKAILDPVREYLLPKQGGTFGLSQWETREDDIRKKFDDARAALQKLAEETHTKIAANVSWLKEAEKRALEKLAEDAVDSLGLPMEGLRDKTKALADTMAFLKKSVDAGTMSTARYNEVMKELGRQAQVEILGLMQSILDEMGATAQSDDVKRQLAEASFVMEVAQLNFLYQQYVALGLITGDTKARMDDLLKFINDPKNWPDFSKKSPPEEPPVTTTTSSFTGSNDPFGDAAKLKDVLIQQAREWAGSVVGDLTRAAQEMKDKLADLQAQAQALWNYASGTLAGPLAELQAAYEQARQHFVDSTVAGFERVPQSVQEARDLRARIDDAVAALTVLNATAEQFAQLSAATNAAIGGFVDDSLRDFERLGQNPLQSELEDLLQQFDDLHAAFVQLGVSTGDMARLEAARVAALNDFWKRATEGIRGLLDELTRNDPRRSSQQQYLDAQAHFRDLQARAAAGDLDALSQLEAAARAYQEQATAYLGAGVGSSAVLDEIVSALQGLVDFNPLTGDVMDPVATRIDTSNDLLRAIADRLGGGIMVAPAESAAARSSANTASRQASAAAISEPRSGSTPPWAPEITGASAPPPVVVISGNMGDPATSAALAKLAEAERKRQEQAQLESRRRATADNQDAAERQKLQETLDKLTTALGTLIRVIENRRPAGLD